MDKKVIKEIRKIIAADHPRQYRITRHGEIHVWSKRPTSRGSGWWMLGHVEDVAQYFGIK